MTGVWTLTLQRPEAMNALNGALLEELDHALNELSKKSFAEAKILILTGAGEKAFVAGADIKELNNLTPDGAMKFARKGQGIFRKLEKLKIPTLAAVNGFALGGGLELALSCDFIYASENAKFGLPEVSLGLIPGFGGTVRLSRVVGLARAKEMIFSGEIITSTQALEIGLVNKVLPLAELLPTVLKTAELIKSRGPLAVSMAKCSTQVAWDLDIDQALQKEAEFFADLFSSYDAREGTLAFVEKRKSNFKGE